MSTPVVWCLSMAPSSPNCPISRIWKGLRSVAGAGACRQRSGGHGASRQVAPAGDVAVALNTALMGDGAVIRIAAGSTIERPLYLLFVASQKPVATFVRSLVVVEEGARAMLIESHEGPPAAIIRSMPRVEMFVGDDAHVDHVKLIAEGAEALHVSTLAAAIGAKARFNSFTLPPAARWCAISCF